MEKVIFNPASFDIGMKIGEEIGSKYINQANERMSFLKPYFEIDNQYLFTKIKNVLFPFLYRDPEIGIEENETTIKNRIEFADLYLPLMSFMTYILLITLNMVLTSNEKDQFHPDELGYKASKNLTILLFCTFGLKLCKS